MHLFKKKELNFEGEARDVREVNWETSMRQRSLVTETYHFTEGELAS